MKKQLPLLSGIGLLLALAGGCKKDEAATTPTAQEADIPDQLSDEAVARMDSSQRSTMKLEDIVLPNGQNLKTYLLANDPGGLQRTAATDTTANMRKLMIIARMTAKAWQLAEDKTYPAGAANEPEQPNGLGYVYGQKYLTKRESANELRLRNRPKDSYGTCSEKLFGLDCSGLIFQIAAFAKLKNLPEGTSGQSAPANWSAVIKSAYPKEMGEVIVEDLGSVLTSELQAGDVVFFNPKGRGINHVGIIAKDGTGQLALLNSYGTPNDRCEQNYKSFFSKNANAVIKKGPVKIALTGGAKTIDNFLGSTVERKHTLRILDAPELTVVSGDKQKGTLDQALTAPIRVRVTGPAPDSKPMAGIVVDFKPATGSGSVTPTSVTTTADGYAETVWTLGTDNTVQQQVSAVPRNQNNISLPKAAVDFTANSVSDLQLLTGGSSKTWRATKILNDKGQLEQSCNSTLPTMTFNINKSLRSTEFIANGPNNECVLNVGGISFALSPDGKRVLTLSGAAYDGTPVPQLYQITKLDEKSLELSGITFPAERFSLVSP